MKQLDVIISNIKMIKRLSGDIEYYEIGLFGIRYC